MVARNYNESWFEYLKMQCGAIDISVRIRIQLVVTVRFAGSEYGFSNGLFEVAPACFLVAVIVHEEANTSGRSFCTSPRHSEG